MRLPNLEKALERRVGTIEDWWEITRELGNGGFEITDPPYQTFRVEVMPCTDGTLNVYAYFAKDVNGKTVMDPLVKYKVALTPDHALEFTPYYWETWPFPPYEVTDSPTNLKNRTMARSEVEEYAREWDAEFGRRGWVEKVEFFLEKAEVFRPWRDIFRAGKEEKGH